MQDGRENDKVIPTSETEAQSAYEENQNTDLGENQFIIPDSVEFFISEPENDITASEESFNSHSEDGLLNVEHFSDYKSPDDLQASLDEFKSDDDYNQQEASSYESLTILDSSEADAESDEPAPQKDKYENPDGKEYDAKKPRKVDGRFDFLELFVFTLVAVMLITTFIFKHSVVDGGSMQNTLQHGEHLIISNLFYTPKKGDIIVCQDYETGHRKPIVKRIIATEGDTIEILPDGSVFVNGLLLNEDYVFVDPGEVDDFPGMPKTTVPEDMIFVMGDHRNKSSDSREFPSTFVREDAILGKVILRFYPFDKFGTVDKER